MHERTNSGTYLCSVVLENLICRTFAILYDKRALSTYRKIGKLIIKSLLYINETRWRQRTALTEEPIELYYFIIIVLLQLVVVLIGSSSRTDEKRSSRHVYNLKSAVIQLTDIVVNVVFLVKNYCLDIIIVIRTNYTEVNPDFLSEKINIQNYFQRVRCATVPSHFRSTNCAEYNSISMRFENFKRSSQTTLF